MPTVSSLLTTKVGCVVRDGKIALSAKAESLDGTDGMRAPCPTKLCLCVCLGRGGWSKRHCDDDDNPMFAINADFILYISAMMYSIYVVL